MTKPNREFCSDHCRAMFHHNKAGYGKLREFMPKMIAREVREQLAELLPTLVAGVLKELASRAPENIDEVVRVRPELMVRG